MARTRSSTPDAIAQGFETLADGSTRLFVLMSQPVKYEAKPAQGMLTYVLKGAHVDKRNNYQPARDGALQHARDQRPPRAPRARPVVRR